MLPAQLTEASFAKYPEKARNEAVSNLATFRQLPVVLAVSILRELAYFDWLFPAEQKALRSQFSGLAALSEADRQKALAPFAALSVPTTLTDMDWVNDPKRFLEALTAYLWASKQIDAFHDAAVHYQDAVIAQNHPQMPPIPRVSLVVLPPQLDKKNYPIFRKLRPHGVFFEHVQSTEQLDGLSDWLSGRISKAPAPLAHFYLDGGTPLHLGETSLHTVSWTEETSVREHLLRRIRQITTTPGSGPEMARTEIASFTPAEFGMTTTGDAGVMDHFTLSILTEGSGTQIFSTTFAQWGARELLRRAQPYTLVLRFGPRQTLQPMTEMLTGTAPSEAPDLPGSFVDADMAAYYTWINQQRLPGAKTSAFLALCQSRGQAVAIGPGLPANTTATDPLALPKLLSYLPA